VGGTDLILPNKINKETVFFTYNACYTTNPKFKKPITAHPENTDLVFYNFNNFLLRLSLSLLGV
jgi:hypothetical protein